MCEHWMAWVSNYTISREAFQEIYTYICIYMTLCIISRVYSWYYVALHIIHLYLGIELSGIHPLIRNNMHINVIQTIDSTSL
jgi:hypothetical protein